MSDEPNDSYYYEEQMWPLTSHTNCYTAYSRDGRWATQRHVCWHVVDDDHDGPHSTTTTGRATTRRTVVQWRELPPAKLCVGYSSCAGWEAYGLLTDQHHGPPPPDEPAPTTNPPGPAGVVTTAGAAAAGASTNEPTAGMTIDGIATTTTTIIATDNAPGSTTNIVTAGVHSRCQSLVGPIMNLPSPGELGDSNYNSIPDLASSSLMTDHNNNLPMDSVADETRGGGRIDHKVAELIVRHYYSTGTSTSNHSGGDNDDEDKMFQFYSLWLPYRPTAIHVMMMMHNDNRATTTTTTTTKTPLVWMGSADHTRLHSYELAMSNNDEKDENVMDQAHDGDDRGVVLQPLHDQELPASVLAIASHADGKKLVVASQDGNIVILQLCGVDDDDDAAETTGTTAHHRRRLVTEATVIIDGPILALSYHRNGTITIGSLCGYVARMKDDGTQLELIVEGLTTTAAAAGVHNNNNSQDDAVLAVDASSSGNRIWVGTRSGRCLLYHHHRHDEPSDGEKIMRWQLVWQVQLPYAVHGIWDNDHGTVAAAGQEPHVIVTTTRGVHVFRTVQSAVQRARSRLTDFITKSLSSGHQLGQ